MICDLQFAIEKDNCKLQIENRKLNPERTCYGK